jgi:hypothetical protein
MTGLVLEIVEFRASGDAKALFDAARAMEPWLRALPGFRWRRLTKLPDGAYLDCIEWADMASAKIAADRIMAAPEAAAFIKRIDGPSVVMRHADVGLAQ